MDQQILQIGIANVLSHLFPCNIFAVNFHVYYILWQYQARLTICWHITLLEFRNFCAANRSVLRRSHIELAQRQQEAPGEVDAASYGHRDVDRFAVLFDMWTCEVNFLANKLKVFLNIVPYLFIFRYYILFLLGGKMLFMFLQNKYIL